MALIDRILQTMLEEAKDDVHLLEVQKWLMVLGTNAKARRNALHKLLNEGKGEVRGTHIYTQSYTTYIYTHTQHIYTLIHTLTYTHTHTHIHSYRVVREKIGEGKLFFR